MILFVESKLAIVMMYIINFIVLFVIQVYILTTINLLSTNNNNSYSTIYSIVVSSYLYLCIDTNIERITHALCQ